MLRLPAAVVLVLATACSATAAPPTTTPTATTAPPTTTARPTTTPPEAGWRELPPGPLGGREQAVALWTGTELLLVGGSDAPPCEPGADCNNPNIHALRDGASYDPATDRWRNMAPAPLPLLHVSAVMAGGVAYLWTYRDDIRRGTERSLLAYHPDDDRWERLSLPEPKPETGRLAAAGDRVVLYQPTQEHGLAGDWLYDPPTATWTEIPLDPLQPAFDRTPVWTGAELVLVGIEVGAAGEAEPGVYAAAAYDPATAEWRRLPDSEIAGWTPDWHLVGDRLVNPSPGTGDGGTINNWGRSYPFGGNLDPATGTWLELPQPEGPPGDLIGHPAAGGDLLLSSSGWVLDTSSSSWTPVSRPAGGPVTGGAVDWAGEQLVLWGGVHWNGSKWDLLATGWAWRPDR